MDEAAVGGPAYGAAEPPDIEMGSTGGEGGGAGGGALPGAGGAGGGAIRITAGTITVTGAIRASGLDGVDGSFAGIAGGGGGGGGSGGGILLDGALDIGGTLEARGGAGGAGIDGTGFPPVLLALGTGGGGGAGGRIKVSGCGVVTATIDVSGGAGGSDSGIGTPATAGGDGTTPANAPALEACTTEICLKDTFIRKDKNAKSGRRGKKRARGGRAPDNRHTNEGANPHLELERDKEVLLGFDLGVGFDFSNVTSARVILTIDPSVGSTGWGKRGKHARIHPLRRDFEEGNGINTGPESEPFRGTGAGATWACAADQDISNNRPDCSRRDRSQGARRRGKTVDRVRITNDLTGTVTFDVTQNVQNGRTQWVIQVDGKKRGSIAFFSREGAAVPSAAPQLVITTGG